MVLGKLPVLLIWIIVEQEPIALAVGVGGGCLDLFFYSPLSFLSSFSLSGSCCCCCIVGYVHGKHLRSCRDGQLT